MIESPAIQRFIVRFLIDNSCLPVQEAVKAINARLKGEFLPGEVVFFKSNESTAKILSKRGDFYRAEVYGDGMYETDELSMRNAIRRDQISKNEIMRFIDEVTEVSSGERMLKRSVLLSAGARVGGDLPLRRKTGKECSFRAGSGREGFER